MADVDVHLKWEGEKRFTATNGTGCQIVLDGTKTAGPSPMDLLLRRRTGHNKTAAAGSEQPPPNKRLDLRPMHFWLGSVHRCCQAAFPWKDATSCSRAAWRKTCNNFQAAEPLETSLAA